MSSIQSKKIWNILSIKWISWTGYLKNDIIFHIYNVSLLLVTSFPCFVVLDLWFALRTRNIEGFVGHPMSEKNKKIRRLGVRETDVCRHHEGPIMGHHETPRALPLYSTEEFKGAFTMRKGAVLSDSRRTLFQSDQNVPGCPRSLAHHIIINKSINLHQRWKILISLYSLHNGNSICGIHDSIIKYIRSVNV